VYNRFRDRLAPDDIAKTSFRNPSRYTCSWICSRALNVNEATQMCPAVVVCPSGVGLSNALNNTSASATLAGNSTSIVSTTFLEVSSPRFHASMSRRARLFPELFGPTNNVRLPGLISRCGTPTFAPALNRSFLICSGAGTARC